MLVAVFLVQLPNGFFMNGAGEWSCDRILERGVAGGRAVPIHHHPQHSM